MFFVFHLVLKMTYIIKCCNCYFDMYILEINRRLEIMDPERKNLLNIIRIKNKWTEWKSKNDILKQRFLINDEIVFHSCFGCIYKVLQNSTYRKKSLILEILKKKCVRLKFWSRSCLDLTNYNFDRNLYTSSDLFCYSCRERLCFHVINNYFNSIVQSFIVNDRKITKPWFNVL